MSDWPTDILKTYGSLVKFKSLRERVIEQRKKNEGETSENKVEKKIKTRIVFFSKCFTKCFKHSVISNKKKKCSSSKYVQISSDSEEGAKNEQVIFKKGIILIERNV